MSANVYAFSAYRIGNKITFCLSVQDFRKIHSLGVQMFRCSDVRGGRAEKLIGHDASGFFVTVWRSVL